ncbi:hypothetical protein [Photobacterium damselae]|uniref:hypothetical protein n=1 Tax=Photobacterium damselae TaxID=38293 RepID=UPI001302D54E|nr:hypothetical protein [Photobacterium damselae]
MQKIKYALLVILMIVLPSEANVLGRTFRVSTTIDLSLLSNGEYITITGFGGGDIRDGRLEFHSLGDVGSNSINTEVRKYNPVSGMVGPILSDSDATQVSWSLFSKLDIKINDLVVSDNMFDMYVDGNLISVTGDYTGKPTSHGNVLWQVKSNSSLGNKLKPGDRVEVQGVIMASVIF